jgi:diguanylate cyclase (GGDEF)-like protein/PAS domain S-box-containing protein
MEQALYDEKERAQVTLHSIGDAVITTDAQARVEYLNPIAQTLTGWTLEEARGRALAEVLRLVDEHTREPTPDPVARCLQEGRMISVAGHSVLISRSGKEFDIADTAAPIRAANGQIHGAVLVFHDVTEARRLERQMAHNAAHDTLTGLVNRREFEVRVERALLSARERDTNHVLCYMDLDQFKIINDTAGHAAGDQVLKQVANLLSGLFRQRDTLARLGGDEFGLLLENCPLERGVAIASDIVTHLQRMPFEWQGRIYQIGVSIGIAPINRQTESLAQALSQADVACYTAKDLGRGRVHVYQWQGNESARLHSEILRAAQLHEALKREQFQLHCQPILSMQAAETAGRYELLLRLQDEGGQLLLPAAFIPSARRYGMMSTIDRWVIQTALRRFAVHFSGAPGPYIHINLSSSSLSDDSSLDFIYTQFHDYNVPPERVCFEITETAVIQNLNQARRFANEIYRMGGRIALDDFGSSFSSFRYLNDLPVSFIKIEGSFVHSMLESAGDRVMVAAINQVGHTLGIQTIAKHVSNPAILEALGEIGVDYAQGYGVGLPIPLAQAWGDQK